MGREYDVFDSVLDHILEEYDAELVSTTTSIGGETAHFDIDGERVCVQVERVDENV